ncbi:unnamed protein product [Prorocentrum cordatum]|uniref:Uncharacterized protein n=1 Tax=Prorocentrum cordatum TaxID=2364126 RepID=A0ABN9RCL7_9DINO|nr:unnamed protein product [Polarella glacialis]
MRGQLLASGGDVAAVDEQIALSQKLLEGMTQPAPSPAPQPFPDAGGSAPSWVGGPQADPCSSQASQPTLEAPMGMASMGAPQTCQPQMGMAPQACQPQMGMAQQQMGMGMTSPMGMAPMGAPQACQPQMGMAQQQMGMGMAAAPPMGASQAYQPAMASPMGAPQAWNAGSQGAMPVHGASAAWGAGFVPPSQPPPASPGWV